MAAHDDASQESQSGYIDENEDLFDFPRVELTLEGLREVTTPRPQSGSSADLAAAVPAALPAGRSTNPTPHPLSSAPLGVDAPAPADLPSSAAESAAAQSAANELTVERRGAPVTRWRMLRVAIAALFVLNGAGFWFLWRTHVSFGAGIDNLRTELDDAAKRLERARREAAERSTADPLVDDASALAPLDALERSCLVLAENEIRVGEYGAARRRLNRLLARADAMNPSLRAEVEPRATFLVARSYQDEAAARRRTQR